MPTSISQIQQESDRIAQLAHELWEQEGRPEGRALDHWLLAESRLRNSDSTGARSIQSQESRQVTARQQLAAKQNESSNGEANRPKVQKQRSRL